MGTEGTVEDVVKPTTLTLTLTSARSRWFELGAAVLGFAPLVGLAFAAWTLVDLARSVHDDVAPAVPVSGSFVMQLVVGGAFIGVATVVPVPRTNPSPHDKESESVVRP